MAQAAVSTPSARVFLANGVWVGGVFPARIATTTPTGVDWAERLPLSVADCSVFAEKRRVLFGPEQPWSDLPELVCVETEVSHIQLSGGRVFDDIALEVYISFYDYGIVTMVFWLDFSAYALNYSEVVELASLVVDSNEQPGDPLPPGIGVRWGDGIRSDASSFQDICRWMEEELREAVPVKLRTADPEIRFSYPLVYIAEVPSCETAEELARYHPFEIAGLANLWLDNADLLKVDELGDVLRNDLHPFRYGATYIAHCCAVELHPKNLTVIADRRKKGLAAQHYRERAFLALECETPITQYFVVRAFTTRAADMRRSLAPRGIWRLLNPVVSGRLVVRALQLSRLRRDLGLAMLQFRNIYLRRKPYVRKGFELVAEYLGTHRAEAILERTLEELGSDIQMTYSMVSTLFLVLLTIVGTALVLVQVTM